MTSWRSSTSQQAQDDLDELLNAVVPFAERRIAERGEFFPFGAVVGTDGRVGLIAAGDEGVDALGALEMLYAAARQDAAEHRAVAFAADVRTAQADALRLEVEHVEGTALEIVLPYRRTRLRKAVQFAPMSVRPGRARIWPAR